MSYTLNHTAEQIDRKLSLLTENKNLLSYPYKYTTFPVVLEEVGDGSFLTTSVALPDGAENKIFLTTCALPAGEYTSSVIVTDLTEKLVDTQFSLEIAGYSGPTFKLDSETTVEVYLNVPTSFDTSLLVKPQIEAGTEQTSWVPYMKNIGSYVDERFNSTNTKIKTVANSITLERLGLKTKTLIFELDDGTSVEEHIAVLG
jgi:hypothetical protein